MATAAFAHRPSCSCARDTDAWYRDYAPMLRQFILLRTGDTATADDCTSETFVRALSRRESFQCQGDGVRPWLFTIARNIVHDWYRKAAHRMETVTDEIREACDVDADPACHVISGESGQNLRSLIAELPPDQADCVRLRFFRGLSVKETATAMRRTETAVRALQHRALRNLSELLRPSLDLAS